MSVKLVLLFIAAALAVWALIEPQEWMLPVAIIVLVGERLVSKP